MQGWRNATRVCLVLLGVALAVLTATGVWLWFRYVPSASAAWPGVAGAGRDESWIRVAHRIASWATVALAVATLVLLIGRRVARGGRGVVAGLGLAVTASAAWFTGYRLPWDQLALWAVTVGNDTRGVSGTFRGEVKYVIVGSREITPGTYRFWAVAHVVFAVLVIAAVVLAWLRTRAEPTNVTSGADDPALVAVGQE